MVKKSVNILGKLSLLRTKQKSQMKLYQTQLHAANVKTHKESKIKTSPYLDKPDFNTLEKPSFYITQTDMMTQASSRTTRNGVRSHLTVRPNTQIMYSSEHFNDSGIDVGGFKLSLEKIQVKSPEKYTRNVLQKNFS